MKIKILDKYIFYNFLKLFLGSFILLIGVGMISKVMETLSVMVKFKGSAIHILKYYYLNLPNMVTIITPAALLFSVAYSIAMFSKNNELTVIMTSGKSFKRILLPLVVFSFILSFGLLWFNEMVTAPSNFKAYDELTLIRGRSHVHRLYNQSNFEVRADTRYYHIGKFVAKREEALGVHIIEFSKEGIVKNIIEGEKVKISPGKWLFQDGNITSFSENGELTKREYFKKKEFNIPESAEYFHAVEKRFEETNIFDLMTFIKEKKERGESFLEYEVEFYWHLGYPFICFFLVFLGGIMGSYLKKGAISQSVGLAVLMSTIYYLIMYFGKSLGNSGILPPILAGSIANIVFLVITIYILIKEEK
ncbi:MAG: LptF/LptG family permease [Spirochaetia bacterium]|nr:LptF/LptG family permease [Spirochaetia bacterium]